MLTWRELTLKRRSAPFIWIRSLKISQPSLPALDDITGPTIPGHGNGRIWQTNPCKVCKSEATPQGLGLHICGVPVQPFTQVSNLVPSQQTSIKSSNELLDTYTDRRPEMVQFRDMHKPKDSPSFLFSSTVITERFWFLAKRVESTGSPPEERSRFPTRFSTLILPRVFPSAVEGTKETQEPNPLASHALLGHARANKDKSAQPTR